MQLKSADLYYGTSRYPINNPLPQQVPFAPLVGDLLEEVCAAVALATGCLSVANVRDRITHNVAHDKQVFVIDPAGGAITIPAKVALIGNGFSVIWE
jgi:hypothetical protein